MIVHFSFSAVTNNSPKDASILVFPESRHAAVEMVSWLSSKNLKRVACQFTDFDGDWEQMYFSKVFSTRLRSAKLVFAHSSCTAAACDIAASIEAGLAGLTDPSSLPLAGQ